MTFKDFLVCYEAVECCARAALLVLCSCCAAASKCGQQKERSLLEGAVTALYSISAMAALPQAGGKAPPQHDGAMLRGLLSRISERRSETPSNLARSGSSEQTRIHELNSQADVLGKGAAAQVWHDAVGAASSPPSRPHPSCAPHTCTPS